MLKFCAQTIGEIIDPEPNFDLYWDHNGQYDRIVGIRIRPKSMIEFRQLEIPIGDDLIRRPASPTLSVLKEGGGFGMFKSLLLVLLHDSIR